MNDTTAHDENTIIKVFSALCRAGLSDQQVSDAITEMQNEGILFRERTNSRAVAEEAILKVIDTYTLGMYRPSVVRLRNKIKELYNE